MPSPIEPGTPKVTPEAFALALLMASSLQIMENLLPRIPLFPWMRMGFSYVIILPFLLQFGVRSAFGLLLARNAVTVLYGGQPFTTFLIGTGSGALAFLAVGAPAAWAYRRGLLGTLGASVALASGFNLIQLAAVNLTLIRHAGFYFQTGPILAWSLLSGAAVALLIRWSEAELPILFASFPSGKALPRPALAPANPRPFLAGLAALILLMAAPFFAVQLPALLILLTLVPGRGRLLLQAWPFFFYLAWLHLFHTPGAYVWKDWITYEGARQFGLYAVRLAALILLGRWLSQRFPWQWTRNARSPSLQGFLLALPLMAGIFASSLEFGREALRRLRAGTGAGVFAPAFAAWRGKMEAAARRSIPEAGIR
jgi:uncharacterized membrane protein